MKEPIVYAVPKVLPFGLFFQKGGVQIHKFILSANYFEYQQVNFFFINCYHGLLQRNNRIMS